MITKDLLQKYANDLLFDLSDSELNLLMDEFAVITENMDIISNIKGIANVKPLSFPYDINITTLRDDDEEDNLDTADVLANCGDKIEDVVIVPKVVG